MTFDDPVLFEMAGQELLKHMGHRISITPDGGDAAPDRIAIECGDCGKVLIDLFPKPDERSTIAKRVIAKDPVYVRLITEFHYQDGDVGSYDDLDVRHLWTHFTKLHRPSHILIRPDTEQGQQISNSLLSGAAMFAALTALVDTINATGGIVESDEEGAAPLADEEWYDLGCAYIQACKALGIKPLIVR